MMNGNEKTREHQNGSSNFIKRPVVPVAELLAAEQALTYEERLRKAMNLKPYLDYLSDLFAQRLSDSSGSEDEGSMQFVPAQSQLQTPPYKTEEASKCPGITQAIHTLNLNLGEAPSLSHSSYLDGDALLGKAEPEASFPSASQFSPSNSYSSSLGLSPQSTDNEKHGGQEGSELPRISDLELHKYLEKPAHAHGRNSPANEYIISYLGSSSNADFKTNRKRKWDHENSSSLLAELKPKSPPSSSSGTQHLSISKPSSDLNREDSLLSGIGIDRTDSKDPGLKIKEDPDKLLMAKGYDDFRDYMKSSVTHDKLNLNQTAREDNDEEGVDGEDEKRNEGMDAEEDADDDSLSDYMNITANSALALDTFFKFDPDDLTSAAQSPMSPTATHILPSLSNPAGRAEVDDSSVIDDSGLSITSDMFDRNTKKVSHQRQTKTVEMLNIKRRRIYILMCKKEVIKVARTRTHLHQEVMAHTKQLADMCSRHLYNDAIESQKMMKESTRRAARLTAEIQGMWKQRERTEREIIRRKIREAEEQKRLDLELNEAREQHQKLNILSMQMRVYAAQISDRLSGVQAATVEQSIIDQIEEIKGTTLLYPGDNEWELMKECISRSVKTAFELHTTRLQEYGSSLSLSRENSDDEQKPDTGIAKTEVPQAKLFTGTLKSFQRKGVDWLINLFDHGVNGILADEAGLGKRVQLLAFFGNLAEERSTWGPFLIIAPASSHQNWQQEFHKFLPGFTTKIYAGSSQERRALRGSWLLNTALYGNEESVLHVLITSLQIVAADFKHLNRVRWQILILDEAQTTTGMKWKSLLRLNCRSRLFLTGRPIQNTITELWKFLHFVMPSLFDADEEFNEWALKNIESHADTKFVLDEKDLSCLRRMLKTFMLKRTKKDVESELPEKIEILIPCVITSRQRHLNSEIKVKIRIEDLQKSLSSSQLTQLQMTNLMGAIMQLRKVCNHPDLIEKRDVRSPFYMNKIIEFYPKTLIADRLLYENPATKRHLFENHLNIYNPIYTHPGSLGRRRLTDSSSVEDLSMDQSNVPSEWSFLRFIGIGPQDLFDITRGGFMQRWTHILKMQKMYESLYRKRLWKTRNEEIPTKYLGADDFLLFPDAVTSFPSIENSPTLKNLVFVSPTVPVYAFLDERISNVVEHQYYSSKAPGMEDNGHDSSTGIVRTLFPQFLPACTSQMCSKVSAAGGHFTWMRTFGDNVLQNSNTGTSETHGVPQVIRSSLELVKPRDGWSGLVFPSKEFLLADSGKLQILDQLLFSLKRSKSQVIIYTQMNRMVGVLEEFLAYRKWNYVLLDNSLRKRDSFRQRELTPEFLVFLGWTRASNLGINLTFADTVIFYDSDWNPAVDREALDRTYRLGRDKKLTVFRLVCEGTIESSIIEKTLEKSGEEGFRSDFESEALKPAELLSLLLKEEELKLLAFEREANLCEDLEPKSITLKRKGGPGLLYKSFKERFARKFKTQELEPSSSVASSVSLTGSSPANSDVYGGEDGDQELLMDEDMEFESGEDEEELESNYTLQDIDCVDGALPSSSRSTPTLDWNAGSISDYDEDLGSVVSSRPKVGRGGGRRGRPPTRVRVMSRDDDGSRRGRPVGRPRKRNQGPLNQGVRGRKPGRPPLAKKVEALMPSGLTLTQSETVLGDLLSSPEVDGNRHLSISQAELSQIPW